MSVRGCACARASDNGSVCFQKEKGEQSKISMRTRVALSDSLSVDNGRMLSFGSAAQRKLHGMAAHAHRACSRWKHNYTRLPSLLPACHRGLVSCFRKPFIQIYSPALSTNLCRVSERNCGHRVIWMLYVWDLETKYRGL